MCKPTHRHREQAPSHIFLCTSVSHCQAPITSRMSAASSHALFLQAQHSPDVGGGLLPIAECQSLHVQADPPPSGASPLPHFLCTSVSHCQAPMTSRMSAASSHALFLQAQHSPNVRGGLLPIAGCQSLHVQADPPPSGASPLPHFLCTSVSHCQAPITSRMSAASSRTRSSSRHNTVQMWEGACSR